MRFIGIDVGLDGAFAVIRDGQAQVFDAPTTTVKGATSRRVYLPQQMAAIVASALPTGDARAEGHSFVVLERQQAMPKQGVRSMFSLGHGYGLWEGILAALELPYEIVGPQVWQKEMLGSVKGKDAARAKALQLFPQLTEQLSLKKHHGRADALLMAEFARRKYGHA